MTIQEKIEQHVSNHTLRSEHIQNIIQKPKATESNTLSSAIPRVLIQFWDDSENIPDDVRECINSWNVLDKRKFTRILFNNVSAENFIQENFHVSFLQAYTKCLHPAMKCDYFRLCYLSKNGGFYIDADECYLGTSIDHLLDGNKLRLNPLCYNLLSNEMVSCEQFLYGKETSSNWIFYVNNNPIISPPNHPLINLALANATNKLLKAERPLYDIQSTTGPGNLSVSLVEHSMMLDHKGEEYDFEIINDWDGISISPWPLSYRSDNRNWRLWNPGNGES